jgi:hypothetical protein
MSIAGVTADQALRHPVWKMGPKNHRRFRDDDEKGLDLSRPCTCFSSRPSKL